MRLREKGYTDTYPRLAYWVEGRSGPVVLFMQVGGSEGSAWEAQLAALREDHQLVYFDHRGVGLSRGTSLSASVPDLARDGARVLESAGFEGAHVVGTGLAGMAALELALSAPQRVLSLTLSATHPGLLMASPVGLFSRLLLLRLQRKRGPARRAVLRKLLYPRSSRARLGAEAIEQHLLEFTRADADYSPYFGDHPGGYSAEERLPAVTQPTLVISGGRDRLVAPWAVARLGERIPNTYRLHLPKAGHDLWFEQAEALNLELRDHIRQAQDPEPQT